MYAIVSTQDYEDALDYISKNPSESRILNSKLFGLAATVSLNYDTVKNEITHTVNSVIMKEPICKFSIEITDYISGILRYTVNNGISEKASISKDVISFNLGNTKCHLNTVTSIIINPYDISRFIFAIRNIGRFCAEATSIKSSYPLLYTNGDINLRVSSNEHGNTLLLDDIDNKTSFSFILLHKDIENLINKKDTILFSDTENNALDISYNPNGYININHMVLI